MKRNLKTSFDAKAEVLLDERDEANEDADDGEAWDEDKGGEMKVRIEEANEKKN